MHLKSVGIKCMFLERLPQIIFLHTLLFIVQHIFDALKKFEHSNVKNTVLALKINLAYDFYVTNFFVI